MGNKRSRNFVALEPEAESPGLHQRGGCHENQELSTAGLTEDSRSPSTARRRAATMGKQGMRSNKMLVFMCINLTNLCCHSVYSVLAAFFPQEAEKKGLSEDAVGIVFASFAAVIFLCSPMAGGWMTHYGKVWVYITGIILVSVSTILFAGATTMPDGSLFGSYCLIMRLLQGVGSAMEETAAYAIIADLDPENISFYLGITEISTGLGYMVGPALGGWLYSIGGFTMPFHVPPEMFRVNKEADGKGEVTLRALMRNPQVMIIAIASMLANSDYAFLEPTLGDHATANKVATSPDSIGMLFSIASVTYTLSCPLIGILANRSRLGPRRVIVTGLVLQLVGFLLIGPSPILRIGESVAMPQMAAALVLFGLGESMSMTPVMDDMMSSCGASADTSVNALSSLMASSFSLGQMIGPLLGSAITARLGFAWACTAMALVLLVHSSVIGLTDYWVPRKRASDGQAYTELTTVGSKFVDDDQNI